MRRCERDRPMRSRRLFLAALLLGFAATGPDAAAQERVQVYAVNYPVSYFAARVGGDAAIVVFPAPPERDPAFWKPTIAEIGAFQQADLIVLSGAGYAQWTTKTSLPRRALLDPSAGFADQFISTKTVTHSHGTAGEHSHTGVASHVWLDLSFAERQAEAIAERLKRLRPEAADAIDARLQALAADLQTLDAAFRSLGDAFAQTPLIASHPRYQYFSRRYGFDVRSVEWDPSEQPTDAQWAALDALVAERPASSMIWEAPPLAEVEAALADRGLSVIVVDTVANQPQSGDFLDALRANLDALRAAR